MDEGQHNEEIVSLVDW